MDWVLYVLAAGVLLLGGVSILLLLRGRRADPALAARADQLAEAVGALSRTQSELAGRMSQLAEQQAAERAELSRTLQERLDGVSRRLGEGLEQSATRTAQSLGELTKHLDVIDKAQRNITDLTGQVITLQDILDNKQARGAFGEVQLNDLVGSILPPSAYAMQARLGNDRRVDCLLRLPNPPGPIAVDSKFPLEAYYALREAADEVQIRAAERSFRQAILKHVDDIRERYIVPGETAESALMFLPSEAVYAELHARFADAVQYSYRARVWIVSPTTLMATLNTVRAVLKDARMREQAGVIQTEVQKLTEDVQRLGNRVQNLTRHFRQAGDDVQQIDISTNKIASRIERIESLQIEEDDAAPALPPESPRVASLSEGS